MAQNKILPNDTQELINLFEHLSEALITDSSDFSSAFQEHGLKMIDGVSFKTGLVSSKLTLSVALAVAKAVGKNQVSIPEIRELGYKVYAALVVDADGEIPKCRDFGQRFQSDLSNIISNRFRYLARCQLFWFEEGITSLTSDFVSIHQGEKLLDELSRFDATPKMNLSIGNDFRTNIVNKEVEYSVPSTYWEINCNAPKENARREAKWMANVFVSLVRLALPRVDYCHRPSLGAIEASLGEGWQKEEYGLTINEKSWSGFGIAKHSNYRVNKAFSDIFHSSDFQAKISQIFTLPRTSLGFRLANGLGWLTRARQTDDYSEKLLFNFTAIEALLSEQNHFAPISETIARFVSVILTSDLEQRVITYKEMKKMYSLRSSLVHRGQREAHLIDSNNVQHIGESCMYLVLKNCDLSQKHTDFLDGLKRASHGSQWP